LHLRGADDWGDAGRSGVARLNRPADQRPGTYYRDVSSCRCRHARLVGDDRRPENLYAAMGGHADVDAAARSAHRYPGVLLLALRAGELQQTVRQRRGRQGGTMRTRPVIVSIAAIAL